MLGTTNVKIKPNSKIKYVEYIESTGTQYIDTGFIPTENSRFELDIRYTVLATGNTNGYCFRNGVAGATTYSRMGCGLNDTGFYYGIGGLNIDETYGDLNRHIFIVDLKSMQYGYDTNLKTADTTYSNPTNVHFTLFCRKNADDYVDPVDCFSKQKLYGCKIYDNDILVRDFKPCKDEAGTYCLYDEVEKIYYYNQGTGNFYGDGYVEPIPEHTKLLMHFETNLNDETGLNTASLVTNESTTAVASYMYGKFGKAIYLPGDQYVSIPLTAENTLGTGDFTIAGWFYLEDISRSVCLWSFAYYVSSGAGYQGIQVWYNGKFSFCCDLSSSGKTRKDTTKTISTNTWYHVALVRYNGTVTLYVDGVSVGSLTASGTIYQNTNCDWKIGASSSQPSYPIRETFVGKIDEFIIVKKALWTANFTPPNFPYGGEV